MLECDTPSCGTVNENRRGFPQSLKNGKQWGCKKECGSMQWHRDNNILALQWKDTKVVTLLTTLDCASDYAKVMRKVREWKMGNEEHIPTISYSPI